VGLREKDGARSWNRGAHRYCGHPLAAIRFAFHVHVEKDFVQAVGVLLAALVSIGGLYFTAQNLKLIRENTEKQLRQTRESPEKNNCSKRKKEPRLVLRKPCGLLNKARSRSASRGPSSSSGPPTTAKARTWS
jgi:hypothetical protein